MGISRGAVRKVVFELKGDARGASHAISAFTSNLQNLQKAWIAQAKFIDQYKERIDRLGKGNARQIKVWKQMSQQLGQMTKAWKGQATTISGFARVYTDEFMRQIEKSGMTLDDFIRKQAEKDASMDSNIQKAKEAGGRMRTFGEGMQDVGNRIRMAGTRLVGFGRQLTSAGRQMLFFSGILAGVAREMVTDFAEYSGTMADVRGAMLLNQEAGEDLGDIYTKLRAKVTEVAEKYAYAERDVMKLSQAMISGGMSGTQALNLLGKGAEFARANMLDMGQAGELIVRAMGGLQTTGMDVGEMLDLLTSVGAKTTESLDSVRAAIGFSVVSAQKFGEGFEKEAIASLVHLIKTGESATVAGRRIQGLFENLTESAQDMEISVVDARGNFIPFFDIIDKVAMHLSGMGDELQKETYLNQVFGQNQVLTVKKLIAAREELRKMATELKFVGGATETLATIHLESFEGQTESATSAWQTFRDRLNETIVGPLSDLLAAFEEFLANKEIVTFITEIAGAFADTLIPKLKETFNWLKDTLETLGISGEEIGGVLGALAGMGLLMGPALLGMGMAFETIGAALNLAGTAASGLGSILAGGAGTAAGAGLIAIIAGLALADFWTSKEGKTYFDEIKDSAKGLINEITKKGGLASSLEELVHNLGQVFGPALSKFFNKVMQGLTLFIAGLDAVLDLVNKILGAFVGEGVDIASIEKQIRKEMEMEWYAKATPQELRRGIPEIDETAYQRRVREAIRIATEEYIRQREEAIPYKMKEAKEPSWIAGLPWWMIMPPEEEQDPYKIGAQFGGRVKKTGFAYVHRGEPILTPEQEQTIKMGLGGGNITINLTMYGLPEGSPYEAGQQLGEGLADRIIQRRGMASR